MNEQIEHRAYNEKLLQRKKKKMVFRIIALVLTALMLVGVIIIPFLYN